MWLLKKAEKEITGYRNIFPCLDPYLNGVWLNGSDLDVVWSVLEQKGSCIFRYSELQNNDERVLS